MRPVAGLEFLLFSALSLSTAGRVSPSETQTFGIALTLTLDVAIAGVGQAETSSFWLSRMNSPLFGFTVEHRHGRRLFLSRTTVIQQRLARPARIDQHTAFQQHVVLRSRRSHRWDRTTSR